MAENLAGAGWPAYADDDGSGQTGTAIDLAFINAQRDAIDALVYSATNPTQNPADTTDEVVKSRGNMVDLDARISGVIDDDAALITPASIVSQSQLKGAIGSQQLLVNEDALIWPKGTAAATTSVPAHWSFTDGGSGTDEVGREGTTTKWTAAFSIERQAGSTVDTVLYQAVLDAAAFTTDLRTETFGLGCWVYSAIASHAAIAINDGSDETEVAHTGGGGWEWLSLTHTIDGAGTYLYAELRVLVNGTAYFALPTLTYSDFAPDKYVASQRLVGAICWDWRGTPPTGDDVRRYPFARPALALGIKATCADDPTGNVTIDVEKYETTPAWATLFSAGAINILAAGNEVGHSAFDGDLDTRSFDGTFVAAGAQTTELDSTLRLNIDAVNAVADITLSIPCLQYLHPWEGHRAYNDL